MKSYFIGAIVFLSYTTCVSQTSIQPATVNEEYLQVVTKRSEKIVAGLGISDSTKFLKVRDIIATQYVNLNQIHSAQEERSKEIKNTNGSDKSRYEQEMNAASAVTTKQLDSLHNIYIKNLSTELTNEQVEKVKDGMTYGVLPITYKGYQEMLPDLTTEQKSKILELLTEAREKAMDAGSSDEKHKWFGKYKGKINNYLSAEGYNMKKASEEWQARIKESKSK